MESVGATRTVPVSEGTPGSAGTGTPHQGPKGAKVRSAARAAEAATPAPTLARASSGTCP